MAVYRRSSRARFILLLLVLTAITLVTVDTRASGGGVTGSLRAGAQDVFAPVQSATHDVLRPIGNFFSGVLDYGSLKAENSQLEDQLAQARSQELTASDAERELQIISQLDHLDFVGSIPTVTAQVVDASSSNFEVSIQINRGSDSGIAVNMPVVAGGGLVGRIEEVSANHSTVLLLTDPTFGVGVIQTDNGSVFLANGTGRGSPLSLDLVGAATKIKTGDMLVTSGLNLEEYPKDIPVATVKTVKTGPGALLQEVTATPTADLSRLEYVQVLQWSPQS